MSCFFCSLPYALPDLIIWGLVRNGSLLRLKANPWPGLSRTLAQQRPHTTQGGLGNLQPVAGSLVIHLESLPGLSPPLRKNLLLGDSGLGSWGPAIQLDREALRGNLSEFGEKLNPNADRANLSPCHLLTPSLLYRL